MRNTFCLAYTRMEVGDNVEQDHIDSTINNNDDNKISDSPIVEESTIVPPRQDNFDYIDNSLKLL